MGNDIGLEVAIDQAGRGAVFARAKALGWQSGQAVPAYVWWGILRDMKDKRRAAPALPVEGEK